MNGDAGGVEINAQGGGLSINGGANGVDITPGQRLNIDTNGAGRLQVIGYDDEEAPTPSGTGRANGFILMNKLGVFLDKALKNLYLGSSSNIASADMDGDNSTIAAIINAGGGLVGLVDFEARLSDLGTPITDLHFVQKKYVDNALKAVYGAIFATNDELTDSETSASLNTAYPSPQYMVGFSVISSANKVRYTRISTTTWCKEAIEVV